MRFCVIFLTATATMTHSVKMIDDGLIWSDAGLEVT